jgi:hypothetical protein
LPSLLRINPSLEPLLPAKHAHGTGTTRVFVVTKINQPAVVAYYAWCMASVGIQPVALLDVISRVASLSDAIGCCGLLVHGESEQARAFNEHLIPELERSPTDPLHLLLKDIRRTLAERAR